ncbi:MAG TPA: cytochrome c [Candidatus Sulfotelmatobacter sp.]|nr:cytochrome c [Candidatus Sulfotelmatobacter sp.]
MRVMKFITLAVILMLVAAVAVAQQAPAQNAPVVKHVPIKTTPATSGPEMFKSYCAVCHGTDAKGNGPAASALKTPPSDLTGLAKANNGKYPSAHVAAIIRGQAALPSHGSTEMPIWGPLLSSISRGHESEVQQRTANLVDYIGALQSK